MVMIIHVLVLTRMARAIIHEVPFRGVNCSEGAATPLTYYDILKVDADSSGAEQEIGTVP